MAWVSNWIQGIIVAVIIGTIIEMILPEGNCKKYIKVVIGVYVLFSIISPVINKVTGNNFSVTNIFDLNEYMQASSSDAKQNLNESQEQQIKSIYETNLKNDIKEKLKSKGYEATNILLDIENNSQYTLKSINITLKKAKETNTNTVQAINEIEIQVGNNEQNNQTQSDNKNSENISSKEKNELKQYLSGVYEIDAKKISINWKGGNKLMLKDKIKQIIAKGEGADNKKKIENLAVFLVILIITLVVINIIWNGNKKTKPEEDEEDTSKKLAMETIETANNLNSKNDLSMQLEEILEKIDGVGKVKVLITYSQTNEIIPMYNEETSQKDTEEKDTSGGTRKVIETDVSKEIIYEENSGSKVPITQSIVSPKIEGAIITAQGAGNATVKANIVQAVEAVTGIASHKIQVFTMSS